MSSQSPGDLAEIVSFNQAVLGQALDLLDHHSAHPHVDFGQVSGAHLRHVIEHYDALFRSDPPSVVGYDARMRDARLERDAALARKRVQDLLAQLARWTTAVDAPLAIIQRAGLDGGTEIASRSSVGRELMFLACHAIHHYALIQRAAQGSGLSLPDGFGKAPSTVHHEAQRAVQATL